MTMTITTRLKGDMLFEAEIGHHVVQADVPLTYGGSDRAPTPPQWLVFSLGACVAALVANFCKRKSINTRGFAVDVTYEKEDMSGRLTNFRVLIRLPHADLSDPAVQNQILRMARRCPVHETMLSMPKIHVQLVTAAPVLG